MSLLEVTENVVRSEAGAHLTDDNVWQLIKSCHRLAHMEHASPLLRKSAESTLTNILLALFSALPGATNAEHPDKEATPAVFAAQGGSTLAANAAATQLPAAALRTSAVSHGVPVLTRILRWLARMTDMKRVIEAPAASKTAAKAPAHASGVFDPWDDAALAATDEVMGAAAGGVDDDVARRALCTSSLRHINVALETAGPSMGQHPELVRAVQVDVCKHLVSNSRTQDLLVLSLTLRVVFNLFVALKSHLKVQLEVFFTSVHLHLADAKTLSPEHKEQALESLLEFCREPMLMLDLYINYDCDVMCTNLFETLCSTCCKNAVPDSGPLNSLHITALEGVLAVIDNIAQGCAVHAQSKDTLSSGCASETGTPAEQCNQEGDALSLRERKALKRKMQLAAARFNGDSNPSKSRWIPYVQELGLLPDPVSPSDVARFLRECSGLDLALVGDYLSEPPEEKYKLNTAVREMYIQGFDFTDMRVDEALRVFLEEFRLPGESQKIERLMEALSAHLHAQSPGPTANADAIFVLSYAIIMLNTDAHNKEVRRKMSRETFRSQLRGVNDGKDFPAEFVDEIYDSIHARQIRLRMDVNTLSASSNSADHGAAVGSAWDGVLARAGAVSAFTAGGGQAAAEYHRDMFQLIADSSLSALSYVWANSSDPAVLLRVLRGFFQCASIASHFSMKETLNGLIMSLSRYWLKSAPALMEQFTLSPGVLALPSAFLALEAPSRKERQRLDDRSRADSIASSFDDSVMDFAHPAAGMQSFSMASPSGAAESLGGFDASGLGEAAGTALHKDVNANGAHDTAALDSSFVSTDGAVPNGGGGAVRGRGGNKRSSRPVLPGPPLPQTDVWRLQHADALPAADNLSVYRCLLTLRAVLLLARGHAAHIKEAWRSIVEVAAFMNSQGALPAGFVESDDLPAPDGSQLPSLLHYDTRVADAKQHNSSRMRAVLSTEDDPVPAGFELRPPSSASAAAKASAASSEGGRSRSDTADSLHAQHSAASNRGMWGMFSTLLLGDDEDSSWTPSDVLVRSLRFEAWRCGFGEMFTSDAARLGEESLRDLSKACMLLSDAHALTRREAVRCCLGGELVAALVIWSGPRWPAVWPAAVKHWERLLRFHPSPSAVAMRLAECAQLSQSDELGWSDGEDEAPEPSVFEGQLSPRGEKQMEQHASTAKLSAGAAHQIAHVFERSVVNALRCVVRLLGLQSASTAHSEEAEQLAAILGPALQLIEELDPTIASLLAPRVAAGLGILLPMLRGASVGEAMWGRLWDALVSTRRNFFALPSIIEAQRGLFSGASVCITPWALAVCDCMQVAKGLLPEHAIAGTAAAVALLAAPSQSHQVPYYNALASLAVGRPMSQLHSAVVKHTLQLLRVAAAGLSRLQGPAALSGPNTHPTYVAAISASWKAASKRVSYPALFTGVQWHEPEAEVTSHSSSPSGQSPNVGAVGTVQHAAWGVPESAWAFLVAQYSALLTGLWCGHASSSGDTMRLPAAVQPIALQECIAALTEALSEFPSATPTPTTSAADFELYTSVWTSVLCDTLLPLVKDTQMAVCALPGQLAAHLRMEVVAVLVRTYLRVAVTAASASNAGQLPGGFALLWGEVLSALVDDIDLDRGQVDESSTSDSTAAAATAEPSGWQSLLADNAHEAIKNIVLVGTSQGWLRTAPPADSDQDPAPSVHSLMRPGVGAASHMDDSGDLWTLTVEQLSQSAPTALAALAQVLPPGAIPGMEPSPPPASKATPSVDTPATTQTPSTSTHAEHSRSEAASAEGDSTGGSAASVAADNSDTPGELHASGTERSPAAAVADSAAAESPHSDGVDGIPDGTDGSDQGSRISEDAGSLQADVTGTGASSHADASPQADEAEEEVDASAPPADVGPHGLAKLRTNRSEDDWVAKGVVVPEEAPPAPPQNSQPASGDETSNNVMASAQTQVGAPAATAKPAPAVPDSQQVTATKQAVAKPSSSGGGFFALLFGEDSETEDEVDDADVAGGE